MKSRGLQRMNLSNDPSSRLGLIRCNKCRRAFFSAERMRQHFISRHGLVRGHNNQNESETYGPNILSVFKMKKHRSKSKTEAILATLLKNWPPEKARRKMITKHHLSKKNIDVVYKRMLISNFSSIIHGTQDVENLLVEEYSKDSIVTQQRSEDLSFGTGLSAKYIRLWFYWRRKNGPSTHGEQLMFKIFLDQPYLSDEVLQMLMNNTGMLISQIRLWFRLTRAKHTIMDFKEVEEKVLWACFLKNPECVPGEKEILEVSQVVGMDVKDVKTIFKCWQSAWNIAGFAAKEKLLGDSKEVCGLLGTDVSSHESVLNQLERARIRQKDLGIPTHCKIVQHPYECNLTSVEQTQFDSYVPLPTGRSSRPKNKKTTSTPPVIAQVIDECEFETCDNANPDTHNDDDVQSYSLMNESYVQNTYGSLKVQCNVLGPMASSPSSIDIKRECKREEQNLYSLFNVTPSQREQKIMDSCPEESVRIILSSSEDENDNSDSDSGHESDSVDSTDKDSIEFVAEVQPASSRPIEIIDLTLDSDSNDDDDDDPQTNYENVSVTLNCELSAEEDEQQTEKANSDEVAKMPEKDMIMENDSSYLETIDFFYESDDEEPLVICESEPTSPKCRSETYVSDSPNVEIGMKLSEKANHPQSRLDLLVSTLEKSLSEEKKCASSALPCSDSMQTTYSEKRTIPIRNSFNKLHSSRKAIFIEPHSFVRTFKKNVDKTHHSKRKQKLSIGASLFSKSLMESQRSAYSEMKKRLNKRKSFTPVKEQEHHTSDGMDGASN